MSMDSAPSPSSASGAEPVGAGPALPGVGVALRAAAPALLGYAAVRLTGVAVLAWWAAERGEDLSVLLGHRWDSLWYLGIVQHGYDAEIPPPGAGGQALSNLAFFPLYPGLIWAVSHVSPLSAAAAGLLISWVCSLAAAWGIFAVGRTLHDRRTGVVLAMLWGVTPHALTESMAYTEPVFTALVAWSLHSVLKRCWVSAGVLSLLAGLTRPTGFAPAAAVVLAAATALWQQRRRAGAADTPSAEASWRVLAGAALAPLGWLAYVGWVGVRLHRWDGYFLVQKEWGSTVDGGSYTLQHVVDVFTGPQNAGLVYVEITATLALSVVLLVLCALDRVPAPLLTYTAVTLVVTLAGAGYFHAKSRFLIPAFPLLLPVALGIARTSKARAATVLGSSALLSALYGGHLALVWTHSP
ncbi:hypothetical protein [Peterkaempfera griseoplana]|uniref:hypothetical protein n=1 Tax=Peterkaempfera griseoplana TaxID=66896 RepID=UPI0006E2FA3E|nr:hypothetical protein [Peterkaempfera griseoplana]